MSFNVTVYETPQSTTSSESSTFVWPIVTINQTEDVNVTEFTQPNSDHIHCCGFTEAVIRLVVSALVSMAAVAFLVYDITSTRRELNRMQKTRPHHQARRVKLDQHHLSRRISSRYVC
ncbi:hypothetical protein QQF64_034554 [Cirrhinus molitorella]|uniref:Uncharacterized protein n=1 Tax=Cirrhinus molitorella TaxID=172907 RepID=A0ABR3L100_9TELE